MNFNNMHLRVIGVGQEWRGDDAAGLLVARHLKQMVWPPNTCRGGPTCPPRGGRTPGCAPTTDRLIILENSGAMSDLLEVWGEAEAVILIDAVRGGGRPGEIYRFPEHDDPLLAELFADASGHAWGLAQTVALGRVLQQLPPYLTIYGIEGRNFDLGQELSPAVTEAIPKVARRIRREIEEYLVARV